MNNVLLVNFVAIFQREGTNVDWLRQYFMDHGAERTDVVYDYIVIDDDPNKAVSIFVKDMPFQNLTTCRLELGLRNGKTKGLPDYHYICVE